MEGDISGGEGDQRSATLVSSVLHHAAQTSDERQIVIAKHRLQLGESLLQAKIGDLPPEYFYQSLLYFGTNPVLKWKQLIKAKIQILA